MAYTPTPWVDNVTPVDAAKMNNIEAGLVSVHETLLNAQDFGVIADDSTNNTAAFTAALAALPAQGGVLVIPPGVYRGTINITANKQALISAYGAILKPLAAAHGVHWDVGTGPTILSTKVAGLQVDGVLGAATAFLVEETDRARLADVNAKGCDVALELRANVASWAEGTQVHGLMSQLCGKGIFFNALAAGVSFAETVIIDAGIQSDGIGIEVSQDAVVYRTHLAGVTIFQSNGHTGLLIAGDMLASDWQVGVESFDTGTGQFGLDITTTAFNTELWNLLLDFTGTFATKVRTAASKDVNLRRSTADVVMYGAGSGGRGLRAFQGDADAFPRIEVAGGFAGGGGVMFGAGTGTPDVQVYRNASAVLESNKQFVALGGLTTKTKAGVPTDADIDQDVDGSMILDTSAGRLYVRSGGVWLPVGGGVEVLTRVNGVDVQNSAAENDLVSYSVAAGVMGASRMLRLTMFGDLLFNNATGNTLTLRVKFGGTTFFNDVTAAGALSAVRHPWKWEVLIANLGVANSQFVSTTFLVDQVENGAPASGIGQFTITENAVASRNNPTGGVGAAAALGTIDTASDQVIAASAQWSAASANNSFRQRHAVLELV